MHGELVLTQLSDSEVKLDWQLNSTIVGNYIIKRKINSGNFEILITLDKNTNHFTDTELLTTNTYYYQLIGANGNVQTEPISNSINPAFAEIADFNIHQENIFSAKLTWQHECDYEEGYIIERREITTRKNDNNSSEKFPSIRRETRSNKVCSTLKVNSKNTYSRDFIQIANLAANSIEFIDEELIPNILYEYKIHSYTLLNTSDESIFTYNNAIPSPAFLNYEKLSISTIKLTWLDSCNGEEGFKIDKKVGLNDWQIEHAVLGVNIEEWIDTNAEINEDIQYRIYAVNSNFISDYSNTGIIDNTIPAPSNLNISQLDVHTFSLNWDDNSLGEEGFTVERKIDDGDYTLIFTSSENVTSFIDDINVRDDFEVIFYRVSAFHDSLFSNPHIGNYIIDFPAPSNFTWSIADIHTIEFNWLDNSNGEDGFIMDRKVDSNDWENHYCVLQENTTSWIDNNAAINSALMYRIYAFSGLNCSDSVYTMMFNPFDSPTNLDYNISSLNSIELSWVDNTNGEQGFKIDRKVMNNNWEIEYGIVYSNVCEWTDNFVEPWLQNEYRIYAYYEEDVSNQVYIQPFITFDDYLSTTWQSKANDIIQLSDGSYIVAGYQKGYATNYFYGKLVKYDALGNIEWQQTYNEELYQISSIKQTDDGGYVCLGRISRTGNYDYWLSKTNATGNIEWEQFFGSDQNDYGFSLVQTNDGCYILAGYTFEEENSGGLLIKTDSNGNFIWNSYFNDANHIYSVLQAIDGGYILAGKTSHFGSGGDDFYLVKTNSNGLEEWSYPYGGSGSDIARSVIQTSDGGYLIAGQTSSFGSGYNDGWVVKVDNNGIEEWSQTYGGNQYDIFNDITPTNDGGYLLTGYKDFTGNLFENCWIVKINSNGALQWESTLFDNNGIIGNKIIQTLDNGCAVAGSKQAPDDRFYILKTDDEGNLHEQIAKSKSKYKNKKHKNSKRMNEKRRSE
jgi:hypothetical protein